MAAALAASAATTAAVRAALARAAAPAATVTAARCAVTALSWQAAAGAAARALHAAASLRAAPKEAPASTAAASGSEGEPSGMRGPMTWATMVLLVAAGAGAVVYANVKRGQKKVEAATKVETFGRPAIGGPWSLVDSDGRPVTSGDFAGRYYLLYFGFTFCPDICPNELVKMARVVDALDKRSNVPRVTPVFVTLDPYRDSAAQVGVYVRDFHPRMVGLTGTPGQVAAIAKAFRVYFAEVDRNEGDEDYLVDHSIALYLIGPDGEFVDLYTQLMTAPEIAAKVADTIGVKSTLEGGWLGKLGFGKRA